MKKRLRDRVRRGVLGVNNMNDNHLTGDVWSGDFQRDTFHSLVLAGAKSRDAQGVSSHAHT